MASEFPNDSWALILGGSSGFGLATAMRLAEAGMNVAIVHRDRRGAMARIEPSSENLFRLPHPAMKTPISFMPPRAKIRSCVVGSGSSHECPATTPE